MLDLLKKPDLFLPPTVTRTFDEMRHHFDRWLNEAGAPREITHKGFWAPNVDFGENDKEYVLMAELPGIEQKDVAVNIQNSTLTIKGERKYEQELNDTNYYRVERSYGSFQRSFTLPDDVKADQISSTLKNGVLTVRLPKQEQAKTKSIDVKVEG